jgi:hypothetical protein
VDTTRQTRLLRSVHRFTQCSDIALVSSTPADYLTSGPVRRQSSCFPFPLASYRLSFMKLWLDRAGLCSCNAMDSYLEGVWARIVVRKISYTETFLSYFEKIRENSYTLGYGFFLPNLLQLIIHESFCHRVYISRASCSSLHIILGGLFGDG